MTQKGGVDLNFILSQYNICLDNVYVRYKKHLQSLEGEAKACPSIWAQFVPSVLPVHTSSSQ